MSFELTIYAGIAGLNALTDNVDVEVRLPSGERYAGTFYAKGNIDILFSKNKKTGENSNGLYLNMIYSVVVEQLTEEVIKKVVSDLIDENQLYYSFEKLNND
jgi:hypothetical protein